MAWVGRYLLIPPSSNPSAMDTADTHYIKMPSAPCNLVLRRVGGLLSESYKGLNKGDYYRTEVKDTVLSQWGHKHISK